MSVLTSCGKREYSFPLQPILPHVDKITLLYSQKICQSNHGGFVIVCPCCQWVVFYVICDFKKKGLPFQFWIYGCVGFREKRDVQKSPSLNMPWLF